MARAVDFLSVLLLILAVAAFVAGIHSLGQEADLAALYLLIVGALLLKSATDMLRPKSSDR